MSSLEEERLAQMVEDFIESESPSPIFSASSRSLPGKHHAQYLTLQVQLLFVILESKIFWSWILVLEYHFADFVLLQEILGSGAQAEAEVLESVLKHMRSKRVAEKTTSLKKWLVLRLKRDGFNASLCQTSWVTSLGCPAGGSLSLFCSSIYSLAQIPYASTLVERIC